MCARADSPQFASNTVKILDVQRNRRLRDQFFAETERLLDLPSNNGSASLPTIQAFYLMIVYESALGRDRTTLTERCRAFATIRREPLDSSHYPHSNADSAQTVTRDQRAVATVVWSSFCAQR